MGTSISGVRKVRNLIGGAWLPASSGVTLTRENPARTTQLIATCPASDADDVDAAMDAAERAAGRWSATPVADRIAILGRAIDLLKAHSGELATADVVESGKTLADCQGEISGALAATRHQLAIAPGVLSGEHAFDNDLHVTLDRSPVGIAALITPWDFPFGTVLRKTVPALVAGNTVVAKPSELTPVTAAMIGEALTEAGLPDGVYNLVFGTGDLAGAELIDHSELGAVSFTGSARVGLRVAGLLGSSDVKVQLEMGGKNPLVVLCDADLDAALDAAVHGAYVAAGQSSTATSRIIVEEGVYGEFRDRFVARSKEIRVGDELDPDVDMGPLSSRGQYQKVLSYLGADKLSGSVVCGGGALAGPGYFVEPTVIERPDEESKVVQEEIFGPVVLLQEASDIDHAIELANGTSYGLCAAVFTRNAADAYHVARSVDVGRVGINTPTSVGHVTIPAGGRKNSGRGPYEGTTEGLTFFTHLKPIFAPPSQTGVGYQA